MTELSRQSWIKFYPVDWRGNAELRLCSLAARGLWMEMLCLMQAANPIGSLLVNGKNLSSRQLAIQAGAGDSDVEALLSELEDAGVFSRDEDGTIYSRRIRRDIEKAERDRNNGKGGGNPNLKVSVNPPVNPPVNQLDNGGDKAIEARSKTKTASAVLGRASASRATRAKARTPISSDAQPTETDRLVADEAGLTQEMFRAQWRKFRDFHLSKGTLMADWAAAWRTWVGNIGQFQAARLTKDESRSVHAAAKRNIENDVTFGPIPPALVLVANGQCEGGDPLGLLPDGRRGGSGNLYGGGSFDPDLLSVPGGLSGD